MKASSTVRHIGLSHLNPPQFRQVGLLPLLCMVIPTNPFTSPLPCLHQHHEKSAEHYTLTAIHTRPILPLRTKGEKIDKLTYLSTVCQDRQFFNRTKSPKSKSVFGSSRKAGRLGRKGTSSSAFGPILSAHIRLHKKIMALHEVISTYRAGRRESISYLSNHLSSWESIWSGPQVEVCLLVRAPTGEGEEKVVSLWCGTAPQTCPSSSS